MLIRQHVALRDDDLFDVQPAHGQFVDLESVYLRPADGQALDGHSADGEGSDRYRPDGQGADRNNPDRHRSRGARSDGHRFILSRRLVRMRIGGQGVVWVTRRGSRIIHAGGVVTMAAHAESIA
jgi:hypothetical protein